MKREVEIQSLREVCELAYDISQHLQGFLNDAESGVCSDRSVSEISKFVRGRLTRAKAVITGVGIGTASAYPDHA